MNFERAQVIEQVGDVITNDDIDPNDGELNFERAQVIEQFGDVITNDDIDPNDGESNFDEEDYFSCIYLLILIGFHISSITLYLISKLVFNISTGKFIFLLLREIFTYLAREDALGLRYFKFSTILIILVTHFILSFNII